METKLFGKIEVEGYEIIGVGEMIEGPVEIGGWYLVPLDQYKSTIPPEAHQAIARILKSGVKVKGFIVAEDMAKVELKHKAKVALPQTDYGALATKALKMAAVVIGAVCLGLIYLVGMALAYDPLLICCTEENQWLLCAEWES